MISGLFKGTYGEAKNALEEQKILLSVVQKEYGRIVKETMATIEKLEAEVREYEDYLGDDCK